MSITSSVRARDRDFEREVTRSSTVGLNVDPTVLSVFAERRADHAQAEYGHDFPDLARSLEREAMEELADCRNYIVWRLDAIHRGLDRNEFKVRSLQQALRHVALAFEELRELQ